MASIPIVLFAALGATLYFSCIGLALARWLRIDWASAASVAPALGWGVFSAVSFPVQDLCGFNRASTALLTIVALAASVAYLLRSTSDGIKGPSRLPVWAFALAALVALIPLAGLLPKAVPGGFILGPTAFDHSKIAMVDEITRLGLPAGNPFFGAFGARSTLSYYYLWHFGAAQLSILAGVSGWEADAAMTGVTAYASILLMMGLASGVCLTIGNIEGEAPGRRAIAVVWVALLCLTGTLFPLLTPLLKPEGLSRIFSTYRGLAGWMVQASWAPQHLAAACCVVLAVPLLADLAMKPRASVALAAGALAAAAFGSSAWIGGVTFGLVAAGVGVVGLVCARPSHRMGFLTAAVAAAVLAIVLALPLMQAELSTLGGRHGGSPIGFHAYEVLGPIVSAPQLRRALDYPAYWLLLLPVDLPAMYPIGLIALALSVRRVFREGGAKVHILSLGVLTVVSAATSWLLVSTIGNNDLGWRAILPGVLVLTAFAAAGLARWIAVRAYALAAAAIALFAASVPEPLVFADLKGRPSDDAPTFAAAPALWSAVRRYAGPGDRVANNPLALNDLTDWPVNPGWAMLSDRASCWSGWETARVSVDLPQQRVTDIDAGFISVFAGKGTPDEVRQMAQDYGCRVVVLTDDDDAWDKDPFAQSPYYRLAEEREDEWRIYVATHAPSLGKTTVRPSR